MAIVEKRIDIEPEISGRADKAVLKLTALSRSEVRGLFDHGCVSLNDSACTDAGEQTEPGDVVAVRYDMHRRYHPGPRAWQDDAFKVVFEDKHLIVTDKAAGVLTVPTESREKDTLLHALERYFGHTGTKGSPRPVHRLDKGVSGLLVFAKTREIAEQLQTQFEARKPEREYAAIVAGILPEDEGMFESHLATSKSFQRYSTARPEEGELAITHFQKLKIARGASFVRVWLETGRRNQIRVHFADEGHPVLGDPRYNPEQASHPQWRSKRMALHAKLLGFKHPVTGKALRFESPLPKEFVHFLRIKA